MASHKTNLGIPTSGPDRWATPAKYWCYKCYNALTNNNHRRGVLAQGCDHASTRCARCAGPHIHESCIAIPKDCWRAARDVNEAIAKVRAFETESQRPLSDEKLEWLARRAKALCNLCQASWRDLRRRWNATPRRAFPDQLPSRDLGVGDSDFDDIHSGWGGSEAAGEDEEDDNGDPGITLADVSLSGATPFTPSVPVRSSPRAPTFSPLSERSSSLSVLSRTPSVAPGFGQGTPPPQQQQQQQRAVSPIRGDLITPDLMMAAFHHQIRSGSLQYTKKGNVTSGRRGGRGRGGRGG